ncbi:hypothetical protein AAVH_00004 [Aphelenchoides avenae]|nr:hypothetical protein AAVH_00004 [Aphelenchus avenae]
MPPKASKAPKPGTSTTTSSSSSAPQVHPLQLRLENRKEDCNVAADLHALIAIPEYRGCLNELSKMKRNQRGPASVELCTIIRDFLGTMNLYRGMDVLRRAMADTLIAPTGPGSTAQVKLFEKRKAELAGDGPAPFPLALEGLLYGYSGRSDVQQDKLFVSQFEEDRCAVEGCRAGAVQQTTFQRYVNVWAEKSSSVDTTTNSLQESLASKRREAIKISRKCKDCKKETQHIRVFTYDQKRAASAKYLVVLVHRRDAPLPTATPEEKEQFKLEQFHWPRLQGNHHRFFDRNWSLLSIVQTVRRDEKTLHSLAWFRHDGQVYKHDDETLEPVHSFPHGLRGARLLVFAAI